MVTEAHTMLADTTAAVACVAALPGDPIAFEALDEYDMVTLARSGAELVRAATRHSAAIAGEIARRSSRELGHTGLAQRQGFRNPEELVRAITGSTAREANTAVRVGRVMSSREQTAESSKPWLVRVAEALRAGSLSVAAADAIRTGIGVPSAGVSSADLGEAVSLLVTEAAVLDADQLLRRSRDLRNEIDEAGIADREAALRDRRSLWFKKLPDGSARLNWTLDPESAAVCGDLFDRATSPRRGGPRFVSGENEKLAQRLLADPRRTEQIASDTFLELLRQGADADSSQLLGSGAPSVRVLVTERHIRSREGHGWIEGQTSPVSIATVERNACSGGVEEIYFDEKLQPIDVGRLLRLFTKRQKTALAARDGGCMWPGCNCPPSWTEAHHVHPWSKEQGPTNIDNGILLCRFHHLLLHNNGWRILLEGDSFWLIPPREIDPTGRRIAMPSKSDALRDALRQRIPRAG